MIGKFVINLTKPLSGFRIRNCFRQIVNLFKYRLYYNQPVLNTNHKHPQPKMFHTLQLSSATLSALRCTQCMTIIFRQDNISEFISYDRDNLGLMEQFHQYPKLQTDADYFVLDQQVTYYSSMKASYEMSLVKNYHPFFKMHMFQLSCAQCSFPLGYVVETVNQSTIWLQDRFLVDVKSCALIIDGKDQMGRLVKTLRLRLARKLVLEQEQNQRHQGKGTKNKEELRKLKQRKMINKLQKIYDSQQTKIDQSQLKSKKSLQENKRVSKNLAQRQKVKKDPPKHQSYPMSNKFQQSLMTTNVSSANMAQSKQDTNPIYNSVTVSNTVRVGDDQQEDEERKSHNDSESDGKEEVDQQAQTQRQGQQFMKSHNQTALVNDPQQQQSFIPSTHLSFEQRQLLTLNLNILRQSITNKSKILHCHEKIEQIFHLLNKLSSQQRYIYNKVPSQLNKLKHLVTYIRMRFIEKSMRGRG